MEFSTFCVAMIQVPCQVVRTCRRIVFRLLLISDNYFSRSAIIRIPGP